MEFKDYYKTLGVDRGADQKAIRQAFRRLARQYHPDVNKDKQAETRFKEINEAYQVLNDTERRAKYDQLLDLRQRGGGWEDLLRRGAPGQAGRAGGGTFTVYGSPEDLGQFSEFFQQLFGGLAGGAFGGGPFGRAGRGGRRGAGPAGGGAGTLDIEDLLAQAARQPGAERQTAGGDLEGDVEITLDEAYRGTQRSVAVPAAGTGEPRRIDVTIPRGVREGQRIRVAGQGQGGDLYLTVRIRPHPVFTRQDDDLYCEAEVPVWVAALGGETEVPTLEGKGTITVPPETRAGRTFRLRGRGMPHVRGGGAGDEFVKVRLTLPHPLTPRDRELFEEMRRQHEAKAANP